MSTAGTTSRVNGSRVQIMALTATLPAGSLHDQLTGSPSHITRWRTVRCACSVMNVCTSSSRRLRRRGGCGRRWRAVLAATVRSRSGGHNKSVQVAIGTPTRTTQPLRTLPPPSSDSPTRRSIICPAAPGINGASRRSRWPAATVDPGRRRARGLAMGPWLSSGRSRMWRTPGAPPTAVAPHAMHWNRVDRKAPYAVGNRL
jgi:hypothetical protein